MGDVLRLRPVVHCVATGTGLTLRGWTSSVTLAGGADLVRLWQRLALALAAGVRPDHLATGPAPVARALELIMTQLRQHDMLVTVPSGWGEPGFAGPPPDVARWLESTAAEPARAWDRLTAATVTVHGSGAVAAAALRRLRTAGIPAAPGAGAGRGRAILTTGRTAVIVGWRGETGYLLPPGPIESVRAAADGLDERVAARHAAQLPLPDVVGALLGGAAVHRLLCAVADLRDPGLDAHASDVSDLPPVLVARCDPLRLEPRPGLVATGPGLPAAHLVVDAVTDPDFGVVARPDELDVPQTPACVSRSGSTTGVGPTADAARLDAVLRAVSVGLPAHVAVGVGDEHARGVALRRAAHRSLRGELVGDAQWCADATARHWWKALTLHFAVAAEVEVRRIAAHAVHAEVRATGHVLGWAVEPTASCAVALAALAATAAVQGGVDAGEIPLTGAAPAPDISSLRPWLWPADAGIDEAALQDELAALVGAPVPVPLGHSLATAGLRGAT